jgi:predicted N-formylglutamate amidohydrolase
MMSLSQPGDPPPVVRRPAAGTEALVLCDHAARAIPAALGDLGLPAAERERHIAWDIGAADVARRLATLLDVTLLESGYSRLVADCNRGPDEPACMPAVSDGTVVPGNAAITPAMREARLAACWRPYHAAIRAELDRLDRPAVISVHSFTPVMNGCARPWQVGVLWRRDRRLAAPLLATLAADPTLMVGDNQPYSGHDASGFTVPHHAEARDLPHVMIELRQDLIATAEGAAWWAAKLATALGPMLNCGRG